MLHDIKNRELQNLPMNIFLHIIEMFHMNIVFYDIKNKELHYFSLNIFLLTHSINDLHETLIK
jgi:hypothetical protein